MSRRRRNEEEYDEEVVYEEQQEMAVVSVSIIDTINKMQEELLVCDDQKRAAILSDSIAKLYDSVVAERFEEERIINEKEFNDAKIENERKGLRNTLIAAGIGAGGAIAGAGVAQVIKGRMEMKYQEAGYELENTTDTVWNSKKHRMNK